VDVSHAIGLTLAWASIIAALAAVQDSFAAVQDSFAAVQDSCFFKDFDSFKRFPEI
jgi:hypothetical protein